VSGRLAARSAADAGPDQGHLGEYQKFIEILVGLLETTRRTLRLTRQLAVTAAAWPTGVRRFLEDPDKLEEMLRPREMDVTVLFCDLRGYSRFAEQKGDSLTAAWGEIQKALDTMSSAVTEKGGIVAGFRGDAVLGFWGWPDKTADQTERAAEAALHIYGKLTGFMIQRQCGLGITHGRALAGRLGAHDLAVVDLYGPVVNLAFRLEEMTKAYGVGIVVSDEVAQKLLAADPNGQKWRLRGLGNVRPRGMNEPLRAYELSPMAAGGRGSWLTGVYYESLRPQWDEEERMEDSFAADPAARCFLRHVERNNGVPPANWDGAFTPRPEEG
ncbi:MAG: adenylate/guanylate cyclase domain-containing protein, partial [Planctomycetes bacterium]|nr:adenylate/guanylate cyclase domain-containing protein [Planctomycetota bacterium]